jgi:hypothetical protein
MHELLPPLAHQTQDQGIGLLPMVLTPTMAGMEAEPTKLGAAGLFV